MKPTSLGWQMLLCSSEKEQPVVRRRNRTAPLQSEVPTNLVADIVRCNERIHHVSLSVSPQARRSHRPAVRRLPVEVTHEPMTITQHPFHPLKA